MNNEPKISVAVCTYRRFELLGDCLELIRKQTLPSNQYEIIVVDNSLQPEESKAFRDKLKGFDNLNYIITEKCGIAFARNVALEHCKAPILLFTDDDVRVPSTWCSDYLKVFENYPAAGVIGGRVDPIWPTSPPSWLSGQLLEPLAVLNWDVEEVTPVDERRWLVTANAGYRVKALKRGGGFCERLGRKGKLPFWHAELGANLAIKSLGYNMLYAPHIQVGHMIEPQRMQKEWFFRQQIFGGASMVAVKWQKEEEIDFEVLAGALEASYKKLLEKEQADDTAKDVVRVANVFHDEGYKICLEHLGLDPAQSPPPRSTVWPVIYIVTLCKNAAPTIDQTVLSVLNQAGDFCIRYHIQDGGSNDGTLNKLEHWKQLLDEGSFPLLCKNVVFTYTSGPDHGIYDGIVKGFAFMSIPQMAFMTWTEAGDLVFPSAFSQLMAVNRRFPNRDLWLGWQDSVKDEKSNAWLMQGGLLPADIIGNGLGDENRRDNGWYKSAFFRNKLWDKARAEGIFNSFESTDMERHNITKVLIDQIRHYDTLVERFALISSERDALSAERDALSAERDALHAERDALSAERNALSAHHSAIHNSLSWRLTAPLRYIGKFFVSNSH